MRVTLLRHCAVSSDYEGCYNGHIDIALSPEGLAHANTLSSQLHAYNFDAIYCSDLLRAKATLEALKLPQPVIYTPLLREKSWGIHEGLRFEQINRFIPYENFLQWIYALDGESISTFKARVKSFFFTQLTQQSHHHVLVVTHAGVIKILMALTHKISLQKSFALAFPYGHYTTIETPNYQFKELLCD
jgi:alpha-ribazole phosphatase/probable phosphoglycerate mutase